MKNKTLLKIVFYVGIILFTSESFSQQIQIDRGIRVAGLWCFPLLTDSLTYLYLPNDANLAKDKDGNPQFSLMRYVDNTITNDNTARTITDATGGAVLHFLVEYNTSQDTVAQAQKYLQDLFKNEKIKIRGPIIFDKGTYSLVSSVLNPDDGSKSTTLLALGDAPVLEGSRIALSFELTPQKSKILLESFKMNTPDISLVFDFSFSGLTDAYNAELFIDWTEVRESKAYEAGGSVYFVSAEVKASFDKLRRDNAIKLTTYGEDQNMESLLNTVYDKLLNLLFKPIEPDQVPEAQRGGLTDALSSLVSSKGALSSSKTTGFGLNVGFQLKEMKTEGESRLNFNSRSVVERHHYITFNIGNFYKTYGNNENYFKTVNIDDPDYTQREIHVGIDGSVESEFDKFVNSVTVKMLKKHQDGSETVKELYIDKKTVNNSQGVFKMIYGSIKDTNRLQWLEYDYQTIWHFKMGGDYTSDWQTQSSSMINLFAPYERRVIEIWGDENILKQNNIRAIVVQLSYNFFDDLRKPQLIIKTNEPIVGKSFEITQPLNEYSYKYSIKWIKNNEPEMFIEKTDSSGIIFIDELQNITNP